MTHFIEVHSGLVMLISCLFLVFWLVTAIYIAIRNTRKFKKFRLELKVEDVVRYASEYGNNGTITHVGDEEVTMLIKVPKNSLYPPLK